MNAFTSALLLTLLALGACLLVSADQKHAGLENEIEDESQIEVDGGIGDMNPEKITDWWGSREWISEGIPAAHEWKKSECADKSKIDECMACCQVTGQVGFVTRKPYRLTKECNCAKTISADDRP